MPLNTDPIDPTPNASLRSGTAARLAGLPVATLRVWERRYDVVSASKTSTGQRLYSSHDVSRLKLLRQLTHNGHAIGTIANLELAALQSLGEGVSIAISGAPVAIRSVVVVGRSAAHKLESVMGYELRAVYEDLEQAELHPTAEGSIDVLLVRLASLQPASVDRVLALAKSLNAGTTAVLYNFTAEGTVEALRKVGVRVRREPATARDLSQLMRNESDTALPVNMEWHAAPRRFSDEKLTEFAERPSTIACECLRHVAEIALQLAGFERYSVDCASSNAADAALHKHLTAVAGAARTSFEQALQKVLAHEARGRAPI
jgi:DNA-binding transcriptional MerR regulator